MNLQSFKIFDKHFMVSITGNKNNIIKFPNCGKFICLESKPYINPLFNHSNITSFLNFPEMFVMKNNIILDKGIFKFTFTIKQVFGIGIINPIASAKIMTLCYTTVRDFAVTDFRYFLSNECH